MIYSDIAGEIVRFIMRQQESRHPIQYTSSPKKPSGWGLGTILTIGIVIGVVFLGIKFWPHIEKKVSVAVESDDKLRDLSEWFSCVSKQPTEFSKWGECIAISIQSDTKGKNGSCNDIGNVKEKIVMEAKKGGVPVDKILAIAELESGFKHCTESGSVKIGRSGEIGLMQITPSTGRNNCGYTADDLKDVNKNIECGVKIFLNKYNAYYPSKNNMDKQDPHDLSYDPYDCGYKYSDSWDRAVRGYNGWSCIPESKRSYVEIVNNKAVEYSGFV